MVSLMGCVAAIRIKAGWLCAYVIIVAFLLLLQFTFGVLGATSASLNGVPEGMRDIFDTHYRVFDWRYLSDLLPEACYKDSSECAPPTVSVGGGCGVGQPNARAPAAEGRALSP